jgi:hypothetical protein
MVKPLTQEHLIAYRTRNQTKAGLLLRAEYCDFMSQTSATENGRDLWAISASKRREEAGKMRNLEI